MRPNKVKRALYKGEVQVGTWVNTFQVPQLMQILATSGFDYVYIDMEHSRFSIETVGDLCFAALSVGSVPIVRPSGKDAHLLSRPLDSGAMGLLIPHVDTRQEAEAVIAATKYPPIGERGMNLQGPHTQWGKVPGDQYVKATNEETLLICQIESDRGIQNLDEILSVPGIDGAVIGRGDLSADLGLHGQTTHPEVTKRVEIMIAACQRHGKIPGLLVQDVASAKEWIAKGLKLVTYANEVSILMNAATKAIGEIRASASENR
jgi:2-keto-3-deoxy-L-rhamnonate aldolase RhmA